MSAIKCPLWKGFKTKKSFTKIQPVPKKCPLLRDNRIIGCPLVSLYHFCNLTLAKIKTEINKLWPIILTIATRFLKLNFRPFLWPAQISVHTFHDLELQHDYNDLKPKSSYNNDLISQQYLPPNLHHDNGVHK